MATPIDSNEIGTAVGANITIGHVVNGERANQIGTAVGVNITNGHVGNGERAMRGVSATIKKRRLRFNTTWDIILLKAVVFGEAHLAKHGESQHRFEEVLKKFTAQLADNIWVNTTRPTWKSLNDRYKKIIADHRVARRQNESASGIVEIRGEREELLDDIVLAVDEMEEGRRTEREERTTMDRLLQDAGEEIRNRAVGGLVEQSTVDNIITPPSSTNSVGASSSRRRPFESDDEDRQLLDEHMKRMSDYESKKLKLHEEHMQFQRESEKNMTERLDRDQKFNERRLVLEEKRFQLMESRHVLDTEERKTTITERKEMTNLLSALAKEITVKSNSHSSS